MRSFGLKSSQFFPFKVRILNIRNHVCEGDALESGGPKSEKLQIGDSPPGVVL